MIRFDSLPPEVMQSLCTPMHEILPASSSTGALFLGSMTAANDFDLLREHDIKDVVQVLDVPWMPQIEKNGLKSHRVDILDTATADLKSHLEPTCQFIDSAVKNRRNILVHCQQGVSRSAAVVIAYLISRYGMSFDAALAHCKGKRACVKPNSGFVNVLREWELTNGNVRR
ncbi:protein-tyrosine phosphatase-like protein [Flagelloscypha sp. PMI_526]|nr:protein-tyrosine phosphatase-like protein [Flagelloscypha sp. PMI_526]